MSLRIPAMQIRMLRSNLKIDLIKVHSKSEVYVTYAPVIVALPPFQTISYFVMFILRQKFATRVRLRDS